MNNKQDYFELLKDPRWQKKRLEILQRDEFTCRVCGDSESSLHVHHVGYADSGMPWHVNNNLLITMCSLCHEEEEDKLKKVKNELFYELRKAGLSAEIMGGIPYIFKNTNRGWWGYDPAINILQMVVDDDKLWDYVSAVYFERLCNILKDAQ